MTYCFPTLVTFRTIPNFWSVETEPHFHSILIDLLGPKYTCSSVRTLLDLRVRYSGKYHLNFFNSLTQQIINSWCIFYAIVMGR